MCEIRPIPDKEGVAKVTPVRCARCAHGQVRPRSGAPAITCAPRSRESNPGQVRPDRFCREQLRDSVLAEDVVQQVFVAAFRDLPRFQSRSMVRTWLFAVTRDRVLDAAKARRRHSGIIEFDDSADSPDPKQTMNEKLDDARLRLVLTECIAALPELMRTAVLLHYQQGFAYEEMARIVHASPGALQATVLRALSLLRRCVERKTGRNL